MAITILCDYSVVKKPEEQQPMRELMQGFRESGVDVYVIADFLRHLVPPVCDELKKQNIARDIICRDDADELQPGWKEYIPHICNIYGFNKDELIFISDDYINIIAAEEYNDVTSIYVGTNPDPAPAQVRAAYEQKPIG